MTNESMSTQHASGVPKTAAAHLNLAERFSSFAEYAASTASLPQTAATSLDVARFHAFTGELTFSVEPTVRLYLDGGSVYHAERDGDPAVSRVLLDAGVIDSMQLQRGVVSVGDVEHLGRLFDRDTTIDRDAVMVVVESATEALLEQIANLVIATVTVSAYRHHPSGIHRWFVAPTEPTGAHRPASGMTQVDRSVVDELPRLGAAPDAMSTHGDGGRAPMRIEWAEPDLANPAAFESPDADSMRTPSDNLDEDIQAELDRFDADHADWTATSVGFAPDEFETVSPLGDFRIMWPDGTQDVSITADTASATDDPAPTSALPENEPTLAAPPLIERSGAFDPPVGSPAVGLTIEPLQIDRLPEPDSAVPDDVASAVRRALHAIENASSPATTTPPLESDSAARALPKLSLPDVADRVAAGPDQPTSIATAPVRPKSEPPVDAPTGFAPPTMDMRAEVMYSRAAADAPADQSLATEAIVADAQEGQPEPATTPVIAVDAEDAEVAARERRGALRRLIGSLRNKD